VARRVFVLSIELENRMRPQSRRLSSRRRAYDSAQRMRLVRELKIEFLEARCMLAAWISQGPFGATNGQVENIANRPVVGAIHAVLAHPTNPDIVYAGGTNGGVWKTSNATAASPTWSTNTDNQSSISIGSMAFDRADPSFQTVYAGNGNTSSFGRIGNNRDGLLRTTDGGQTWTRVNGGGVLVGKNISGVYANGSTIVVGVNTAVSSTSANLGMFRSTDGGVTFSQINNAASTSGLPLGRSYDLTADPNNPSVLYTTNVLPFTAGNQGVYKSIDSGATWTRVSSSAMNAQMTTSTSNLELSAGNFGEVYAAIINSGVLVGLYRSPDAGVTWATMDIPSTNENGTNVGLNPGGPRGSPGDTPDQVAGSQGAIHFSIMADPTDANIVYVGGDRQPRSFGDTGGFPNSIGANDFSGRLFRGDASKAAGTQFVHLTHRNNLGPAGGGTASSSSPHADSRDMAMDANGNIIESDDGGIYRRISPKTNTGDWFSIIGNLALTEMHDVAYDSVSNTIISGNQDTGTTYQPTSGAQLWTSLSTADGGDVVVDDVSLAASNQSVRYSSFQNLGGFRRTVFNAAGSVVSLSFPALSVVSGAALSPAFRTPVQLNSINPQRLVIQGSNGLYESVNGGTTLQAIGSAFGTSSIEQDALAYGGSLNGVSNLDVVWVGSGSTVGLRTTSGGSIVNTPSQPTGGTIRDLIVDPDAYTTAAVTTNSQVFWTTNSGTSWTNITGNLPATRDIRSMAFVPGLVDSILVGTNLGIFATSVSQIGQWLLVGTAFPNVLTTEIEYDSSDNVLVAGTLGRGAWLMSNAQAVLSETFGAPTNIELSSSTIVENNVVTATVGAFTTTDPTPGETFTYSMVSGIGDSDNSSFSIVGNTIRASSIFDFETRQAYSVRVRSTDASGWWTERSFAISVANANDAPTSNPGGPYNAVEGVAFSLTGTGSDQDVGSSLAYAWDFNYDGATFDVESSLQSPQISFADDGPRTIALRVTDNGAPSLSTIASTLVTVSNSNPLLTRANSSLVGNVLSQLTNTGTWSDVAADTVSLSASLGLIIKNGDGTWAWSYTPPAAVTNQTVTITAADEDGGLNSVMFSIDALVAITNRQYLYSGSSYLNIGGVAAALELSKTPLRSSTTEQATSSVNVINYSRGLNGVVLDIAGLANNALTTADFTMRVAPAGVIGVVTPVDWPSAPNPTLIEVTPGNATTAARVRLEWLDNSIQNTWLQIIVKANANTGLINREVFYFGHAMGEISGGSPYRVTAVELSAVQTGISNSIVSVSDARDINKDRRVTAADLSFIQVRVSNNVLLNDIIIPAAGSPGEGGASKPSKRGLESLTSPNLITTTSEETQNKGRSSAYSTPWLELSSNVKSAAVGDYVSSSRSTAESFASSSPSPIEKHKRKVKLEVASIDDFFIELERNKLLVEAN